VVAAMGAHLHDCRITGSVPPKSRSPVRMTLAEFRCMPDSTQPLAGVLGSPPCQVFKGESSGCIEGAGESPSFIARSPLW
jgi:hypothetical protein